MIKKKNDKSNLEKKRVLFFEMGIMIALATLLVAFESGTTKLETDIDLADYSGEIDEELIIQRTVRDLPKPKPPMMPIDFDIIKEDEIIIDEPTIDFTSSVGVDEGISDWKFDIEEKVEDDIPFIKVEKMPTYRGHNSSYFQKHLQELVKYPQIAQNEGIDGKVFLEFVVDEHGKVIRERILRSPHSSLSDAVLAALKKTETWTAGEQRGKKVKVSFTVPVFFKLN